MINSKIILKRKIATIFIACVILGTTACGDTSTNEITMREKGAEAKNVEGKVQQEMEDNENNSTINLENIDNSEILNQEEKQEKSMVSYEYKDIAMSIELPKEWEYEIKTVKEMKKSDELKLCAIDFWLKEKPDVKLEFAYWKNKIGLCATGVTIEEITLHDMSAWRYTEKTEDSVWVMVIYERDQKEGVFAVDATIDNELWEEYESDIMELLSTVNFKG